MSRTRCRNAFHLASNAKPMLTRFGLKRGANVDTFVLQLGLTGLARPLSPFFGTSWSHGTRLESLLGSKVAVPLRKKSTGELSRTKCTPWLSVRKPDWCRSPKQLKNNVVDDMHWRSISRRRWYNVLDNWRQSGRRWRTVVDPVSPLRGVWCVHACVQATARCLCPSSCHINFSSDFDTFTR